MLQSQFDAEESQRGGVSDTTLVAREILRGGVPDTAAVHVQERVSVIPGDGRRHIVVSASPAASPAMVLL